MNNNKNEIRRMRDLMNEGLNLAKQYEGNPSPNEEVPSNLFSEFQRKKKELEDKDNKKNET